MDADDIRILAGELGPMTRDFVRASLTPITKRLDAIDKRFAELPVPRDGTDANPDDVASLVFLRLKPEVDEIRASLDAIKPEIPAQIARAIDEIPKPKDGANGTDGNSITADDVAPLIVSEITKRFEALPIPKDGAPGVDGKSVTIEDILPLVDALPKAKDGIGLAGAVINRDGNLVVTMTDGTHRDLGQVVGRDGEPGKDGVDGKPGVDGFDLKDFVVEYDGERHFDFKFVGGDETKSESFDVPFMLYRGVFKNDRNYVRGDCVTWDGSTWHANKDTGTKPHLDNADWQMCNKRGRDGKVVVSVPRDPSTPVKI